MKKHTFIIGTLLCLTGCGSNSTGSTSPDQNPSSNSENSVADMSTSGQNVETPINDGSIFIDCKYEDNFHASYKIKDNVIYMFDKSSNNYIKDVIYGTTNFLGEREWSTLSPRDGDSLDIDLNMKLDVELSSDDIKFSFNKLSEQIDITPLYSNIFFNINRKTGAITQKTIITDKIESSIIIGMCSPGNDRIINQNSF
jgi:hypothetical protein